MADFDPDPNEGFVDKRKNAKTATNTNLGTPGNYGAVGALRTRLAAQNPTYWTAARLNNATKLDLQYALRLADDSAGV